MTYGGVTMADALKRTREEKNAKVKLFMITKAQEEVVESRAMKAGKLHDERIEEIVA